MSSGIISAKPQQPVPNNIGEVVGEIDKYTAELLVDITRIADAVAGSNGQGETGGVPSPVGLLYNLQTHRQNLGLIGEQVYRIKAALGL